MSRDIRSTSAHDAMVKNSKEYIKSNRVYNNPNQRRNLWPENEYYDRETLYLKLQQQKEETNIIKDENTKLKTRLSQYEKELTAYYKLFEEQKVNLLVKSKPADIQIHQMRSQNKQLTSQIYEKNAQIDLFKRNIKLTRYQEIEVENRLLKEELQRLRSMIVQQELQFQKFESQVSESHQIRDNFLKTQQNYLKKKNENEELSSRLQKQEDYIKSLKKDIDTLTIKKQKLETEITKISKSRYPEDKTNSQKVTNSSNSFRNKLDKSESSNQSIKPKYQEELQLKLILRGVTTSQLEYMLDDLKQQASNIKKSINKDDISYILAREPFSMQQEKINEVVKSLKGQGDGLADQLQNYIGAYKSFNEIQNFSLEKAEQTVMQSLKDNETSITKYFSQKKQQSYDKGDLNLFIEEMNFGWDEGTKLFYLINVFEKSGEKLQFEEANMIDPFMSIQQSERIIEESEEDVFDRNSEVQEATEEQEQDSI